MDGGRNEATENKKVKLFAGRAFEDHESAQENSRLLQGLFSTMDKGKFEQLVVQLQIAPVATCAVIHRVAPIASTGGSEDALGAMLLHANSFLDALFLGTSVQKMRTIVLYTISSLWKSERTLICYTYCGCKKRK